MNPNKLFKMAVPATVILKCSKTEKPKQRRIATEEPPWNGQ